MDARKIFDKLDRLGIYIVDRETMVTYYENPTAQKYSVKNRIGKPCYSIHGNKSMCRSCPLRNSDHVSLVNRADLGMIFVVRSSEISWEDHPAYLIAVARQATLPLQSESEKSMSRMSRALQKSVNVYTEINMETMRYRQINLRNAECYNVADCGEYAPAYEHMCRDEIHPDDVEQVRATMAPEVFQRISADSDGVDEVVARYRLKNSNPMRIMESRAIFMRDELPHYVVSIARDVTEEVQLRQQAHAMDAILNHVRCGIAIYRISPDGRVHVDYVNDGLSNLTECSKEKLTQAAQNDPMVTIDAAYRPAVEAAFQKMQTGEQAADVTFAATTFAGNHPWITLKLTGSHEADGSLRIYGTFFDVTAEVETRRGFQEKYEIERRRSQDDRSVLAYAVFNLHTHTTIEMDRRKPFGILSEKMTMAAFCADIAGTIVSSEKREQFKAIFDEKALLQKHEKGIDEQSIEYQRMLPNGKVIWVKSSFHIIADSSHSDILLFYYCNDINISKSLELMTTHITNEDYDMLGCINFADDSAIMLYGRNSSQYSQYINGVQRQEKYSDSLSWFVNNAVVPEEREQYHTKAFTDQIKKALSKQDRYEFTLHVLGKNQEIRTKKIRYTRYDAESAVCFFSQIDITDTLAEEEAKQKELQKALSEAKQANEAKTAFLSRMSHDMRTPMNGVLGLAALMREETNLEEIHADVEQLQMSGQYLLQLINDTLDMSKIESGKMELRLKPIDSEAMFGNIFANASQLAKEKSVALQVQTPNIGHGNWVRVLADAARLEQIIMNVLSNAIKFTPVGGTVQVIMETVSITDTEVVDRYIIRDTGIGISEEFLPHIFEPFAQEGRMHTGRESGTGLGMSIVKQLVDLMNSSISIKSKPGEGTEVTLLIRYPVSHETASSPAKANADLSTLSGKKVLLCEDHPLNTEIAVRLLEKRGISVECAENGKLGVEQFSHSPAGYYDAILMDIRMPVMNGLEAAKAIRSLNRSDAGTVPIIAMTANAFDDDVKDCLSVGMNDHIAKPIEPAVMYETIARALANA